MWLMSNRPTRVRTAICSAINPEYSTGMSHPPKSTIFAPDWRWLAFRDVLRKDGPADEATGELDIAGILTGQTVCFFYGSTRIFAGSNYALALSSDDYFLAFLPG